MNEQPEEGRGRESWAEAGEYWKSILTPPVTLTLMMAAVVGFGLFVFDPSRIPSMFEFSYIACCLALAVLAAVLAAVVGGLRVYLVAVFLLLFDGWVFAMSTGGSRLRIEIFLLPLMIAAPIVITLQYIKIFKGTFSHGHLDHQQFDEGLQFKIKHLFIITAAIAILIAILKALAPNFSFNGSEITTLLLVVGLLSVNALVSVWAVLGNVVSVRLVLSALTAVLLVLVCLSMQHYFVRPVAFFDMVFWLSFTALSWVASTLQLYLFRREGYRFVRHEN